MMKIIPYNRNLTKLSRELRNESTLSEVLFWTAFKKSSLKCERCLRQKPILEYIVDFYFPRYFLAIEIDGSSHDLREVKDEVRELEINRLGIKILHFTNSEIKSNPFGAIIVVQRWIDSFNK